MPPHPSTNFEIQKYYQNKPLNELSKTKDGAYITNLDEYQPICEC